MVFSIVVGESDPVLFKLFFLFLAGVRAESGKKRREGGRVRERERISIRTYITTAKKKKHGQQTMIAIQVLYGMHVCTHVQAHTPYYTGAATNKYQSSTTSLIPRDEDGKFERIMSADSPYHFNATKV